MGNPAFENASLFDALRPSGPVLYLEHDDTWDRRGIEMCYFWNRIPRGGWVPYSRSLNYGTMTHCKNLPDVTGITTNRKSELFVERGWK
jgi:hypothetical protein